jgi:hypothetical protein
MPEFPFLHGMIQKFKVGKNSAQIFLDYIVQIKRQQEPYALRYSNCCTGQGVRHFTLVGLEKWGGILWTRFM